jgi:prepilin-type N-terminal cleavage/methylation domain-containing protein
MTQKPCIGKTKIANGFSLTELMVAILILGVLSAMAIPGWKRMQKTARLSGDGHSLSETLSVAKMRAAANFTESRVFLYTGTTKPYFRIDVWNKSLGPNGCWVPDGKASPAQSDCLTSTTTTGNENYLSPGVSVGYGTVSTAPQNSSTTLAQASPCKQGGTLPTNGTDISSTSCIQFNSRGFPVPGSGTGFYITDGTRVYGTVTNAMGLIHTYVTDAGGSVWHAQ